MLTPQEENLIRKEQIEVQELFNIEYERINEQNYIVLDKGTILAKTNLSLTAQRILKVVASMIKPTDQPHKQYRFRLDDFCKVFNLKATKINKNILNAFIELRQHFTLPVGNGRVTGWISYGQINSADVVVEFDPILLPFYQQALAGQYKLINVKGFGCSYTFRFYELFCLKLGDKKECEFEINIENLKIWLQIENKYKLYGDLRKRIITPMLKDINGNDDNEQTNFCNLRVKCEEVKSGKSIVSLKFQVKKLNNVDTENELIIGDQFFESLNPQAQVAYTYFADQIKVTKSAIIHCVNTFGQEVFEKIYREIRFKNPNEVKNMAAYAATCLRNGYYTQTPEPIKKIETRLPEPEPLEEENKQTPEEIEQQKIQEEKEKEDKEKVIEELKSLPEDEQEEFYNSVLEFAKGNSKIYYTLLKKYNHKNIWNQDHILAIYLQMIEKMN